MLSHNGIKQMPVEQKKVTRRNFLRKSALFTAAAIAGTNTVFSTFSRASSVPGSKRSLPAPSSPQIAIIIDDVGYSRSRLMPFLDLGVPITFSILPRVTYSLKLAEQIHAEGHEIMLHQPMQPHSRFINPGPGALFLWQDMYERNRIIEENIASFPYAAGVNNHMGSLFTESEQQVGDALKIFKKKGLFFVDSITTSHSVAYNTARKLGIPSSCRDVFIDPNQEDHVIAFQLEKLRYLAKKYGQAIGIGHPKPETLCILKNFLEDIDQTDISLVYVSDVITS